MSTVKKLVPKLSAAPEVLKARKFVDDNFGGRAMITNRSKTYLRAYLKLEDEERSLADTLVQVLHQDYRYDTVSYNSTSHRVIIEWDPRHR